MKLTRVGVDLAKQVFQVHGVNEAGHAVVKRRLRRTQVISYFASLPPCLIGMEACSGAHHWARKLAAQASSPGTPSSSSMRSTASAKPNRIRC